MEWFYLALLAPFFWAVVNLLDDNLLKKVYRTPLFGMIISGFLALIPLLSLPFVEFVMPATGIALIGLLAGVLIVSSYWFYFKALSDDEPSIVVALWGLTPALIPFLAYLFLGEVLSLRQYLGFGVVLFSSIGLSSLMVKRIRIGKTFWLMGGASLLSASSAILLKYVYGHADFWSGFLIVCSGMGIGAFLAMVMSGEGRKFPAQLMSLNKWFGIFVVAELFNIAAVLTSNLAVSKGPVSLVKVVEGVQPLYVLFLAIILYPFFPVFFREGGGNTSRMRKMVFMILIIGGLFLIYPRQ